MDTTQLLYQLWPLVIFLIAVAGGAAVALYRVNDNAVKIKEIKRCLFNENGELIYITSSYARTQFNCVNENVKKMEIKMSGYMTIENHTKDCEIASFKIKNYFTDAFETFQDKLLKKMAEQQKPVMEAISSNAKMIVILDKRTRHLKDMDEKDG